MGLPMDTQCILCHLGRNVETARALGDEATATAFARELMQAYIDAPADASAPTFVPVTSRLFQKYYALEPDRFRQEKEESNRFVLERMDQIRRRVETAPDPVFAGLQFAILGNYIDFSALQGQVSFEMLDKMLDEALEMKLEKAVYARFLEELETGKRLLYITDNAGEICFDRIFAEQIALRFPHLQITFCVRGGFSQNDATREDAILAGVPFPVIDNGNEVAGTELSQLSQEAKDALQEADVIVSKGQGNVETLLGCGLNIYYAFLIKCVKFQNHFQKPKLTPMFIREKDQ